MADDNDDDEMIEYGFGFVRDERTGLLSVFWEFENITGETWTGSVTRDGFAFFGSERADVHLNVPAAVVQEMIAHLMSPRFTTELVDMRDDDIPTVTF